MAFLVVGREDRGMGAGKGWIYPGRAKPYGALASRSGWSSSSLGEVWGQEALQPPSGAGSQHSSSASGCFTHCAFIKD